MKIALITGVTGQDGSYLTELLLEKNYKVYGLSRKKTLTNLENLRKNLNSKNFIFLKGDLLEESKLNEIIRKIQPDEIYNLAGDSFVPGSWVNPIFTCNVNALGVLKLLNAIRIYSPYSKFYQASSSEIFGKISKMPQDENTYHYPISPYGCAKSFGFNITRNYRESYGLFACNGILFNHESERRDIQYVTRKITKTVAEINIGLSKNLIIGNLDAKRDWGYAPDYVEAMWLMLQHKISDDYVIASGKNHSVRQFIECAFKNIEIDIIWEGTGLNEKGFNKKTSDLLVKVSKKYFRPAEVDILTGDASKARNILGWKPKISFEEMITKMVNFDISELKNP